MKTEPDWVPGKVKTKMKKLMIAATAALCAAVGFGDITSQNVVGYNTLNTSNPTVMLGCSFRTMIGDDAMKLSAIQGDFESMDEIQVSYLTDDGFIEFNVYQYLTTDDGVDANGWYDGSWETAGDVEIPRGSAVWFSSSTAKNLTSSGEVVKSETIHPAFTESTVMICSAYPIAFNPNADTVAWNGLSSMDEIQVAYMTEDGFIEFNVYQWLTEDDGVAETAWYDGSWEKVVDPIAVIGQGFWLSMADCESVTMVETSPLAK